MLCVGLTGGIGTGKSTVSRMFKEKAIPIIDADIIAKNILDTYPELLTKIRKEFGDEYFTEDGALNRKKLGNFIFKFPEERKKLEDIMIPKIKDEIFKHVEVCRKLDEKLCVVDAPILIETGVDNLMDFNILVWTNKETQIKRVMKRDNLNLEEVMNRINSQMPMDEKKKMVDFIIDNSYQIENTERQLDKILNSLSEC
ncbi:dephospho-CoA kinase [Clostridium acidisoli DSM 12555]|uniref:Dephospho-CoA kinase n=1 Tax=Clostridium acidisoli DSM 12555 TaxID=1121291 RepID=A0A1W1X6G9_9CLOT|nr:dephospho-CoA kinase [Clostridium acidisoli]SMC19450.1 dephospho-CoA kinase [Clostridium acidisoli DSM 12555]